MTCLLATGRIRLGRSQPAFPEEGVIPMSGRPLLAKPVPAGLPVQAADFFHGYLSLDEHLIDHPDATFFAHAAGDSMTGFGIHDGDLLIVDRALDPADRSIVLAVVDGEFTVKQFCLLPEGVLLRASGARHWDILVTEGQEFAIWGVVVWAIHRT